MHKFHKIDPDHNILHVNKSCIQILRSNAINQRIHTPLGSEGRTRIAYNVLTVDCALDVHTLLFYFNFEMPCTHSGRTRNI